MSLKDLAGRAIRLPWVWFQSFGRFLGHLNNSILLGLSFYLIVLSIGLIRRTFRPEKDPGGWLPRETPPVEQFEKQY